MKPQQTDGNAAGAGDDGSAHAAAFSSLPEHLTQNIIKMVLEHLTLPEHLTHPWRSPPNVLKSAKRGLETVSKEFHRATIEAVNAEAPLEILTPMELHEIKVRAGKLRLIKEAKDFYQAVIDEWGDETIEVPNSDAEFEGGGGILMGYDSDSIMFTSEENALEMWIDRSCGSTREFKRMMTNEYRRWLVIKAVETLAAHKLAAAASSSSSSSSSECPVLKRWTTKCQPTVVIDMFWHAHLASNKYDAHCKKLTKGIGGNKKGLVISHEEGYTNPRTARPGASDAAMDMKLATLFRFELSVAHRDTQLYEVTPEDNFEDLQEAVLEDQYADCG